MAWYFFHWTPRTIAKLADREITTEEYEDVVCDPMCGYTSGSSGHNVAEGWTSTGRYLLCVYEVLGPDDVLPITGYEVEPH